MSKRVMFPHRHVVLLFTTLFLACVFRLSVPSYLPPSFYAFSHASHQISLDALLANLNHSTHLTPLHAAYKNLTTCPHTTDLTALRTALKSTSPKHHPFVVCISLPLSTAYLNLIQKLSYRLGQPFVTTADPFIISQLHARNVLPVLPSSPDDSLFAMSTANSLLVHGSRPCAVGARLANGVVYYTNDYHSFVSKHGYEWLPNTPARLDAFDRSHRATLSAVGIPQESCCNFHQGVCHPLQRCDALVIGAINQTVPCRITKVCHDGICPDWKAVIKTHVPDIVIMDISGHEFSVLQQIAAAHRLPTQIIARVRVWSPTKLDDAWSPSNLGYAVSRDLIFDIVHQLRERGFKLVHRVDDESCDWCAYVTFLRE